MFDGSVKTSMKRFSVSGLEAVEAFASTVTKHVVALIIESTLRDKIDYSVMGRLNKASQLCKFSLKKGRQQDLTRDLIRQYC